MLNDHHRCWDKAASIMTRRELGQLNGVNISENRPATALRAVISADGPHRWAAPGVRRVWWAAGATGQAAGLAMGLKGAAGRWTPDQWRPGWRGRCLRGLRCGLRGGQTG